MPLLTIEEAAGLLHVKVSWLYERTRTNEVPHIKLGKYLRFDQDELIAWTRHFRRDGCGRGVFPHHRVVLNERPRPAKG